MALSPTPPTNTLVQAGSAILQRFKIGGTAMSVFDDLFNRNAITAMARRLALADLLENRNWSVDMSRGAATFGSGLTFPPATLCSHAAWAT
jgi:uncharacterized protein YerC